MASENEVKRETHEAVDDVIESMERFASRHWMHDEGQNVREFAARLKAAWKRERDEIEAQALSIGGIVEAERHKPGDAEALTMTLDEAIAHAEDVADRCDTSCGRKHRQLADWLKELRDVKSQHVGNAAAMRSALKAIWKEVYHYAIEEDKQDFAHLQEVMLEDPPEYKDLRNSLLAIAHLVDAALSAPPRNCDVGTAEEQYKRYSAFTSRWTPCSFNGHARCAWDCPVNKKLERDGSGDLQCPFVWAQTPYAAELKGGKEC